MPVLGDEVAREARRLRARKPRADADALRRVAPLRDRCAELVQRGERSPVRVRDEQADVLEAIGEELRDPLLERIETLAGVRRDEECTRVRVLDAPSAERIECVDLVEDELDRDLVGSDLG